MTYDRLAITAALVAAADLLSKRAIVSNLVPGQAIAVVPPVARIVYVQNGRGAMGLFADNSIVLIALTVVACAAIAVVAAPRLRRSGLARVAFGAVLGGALGNDLDRAVHGFVVDFIAVGRFYVFNLADAAITLGLIALAVPAHRPRPRQAR